MKKVLEIEMNKVFEKEKDVYPFLKNYVFNEAVKLYTPILKGFPDFIVVSYKAPYNEKLKPSFVEVKLNNNKLSYQQAKFISWLSKGFTVYVFEVRNGDGKSRCSVLEWVNDI